MAEQVPVVAPLEAIAYFRRKGYAFGFAWQDVWQEEHARAFTVAKAMTRDLLEDIRGAVDRAIAEGRTLDQFRAELRPLLEAKGWWGRKPMTDPLTGLTRTVQLGSPRRLRTIFDVNMRMAYQAGRWERMQREAAAFPYVRYVSAGDARVRPQHRAWHGVIRPIGDPWWDTHYPPCGWSCRCTAVPVNDRTLERRGWEVTERPPEFMPERYVNPRTGEVSAIEAGISPGFNYNVGKAYLDDLAPRPAPGNLPPAVGTSAPPVAEPAAASPRVTSVDDLSDEQREAIRTYSGDEVNAVYEKVNRRLRSRRATRAEKPTRLDRIIETLDSAFEHARLPRAATVYRGVSGDHAAALLRAAMKKGDPYVDAAFLSTSRSQAVVAKTFANAVLAGRNRITLKIYAPEGSRALDIASISRHPGEKEILFARSTRMRVRRWIPERSIFELEVVPDEGGPL